MHILPLSKILHCWTSSHMYVLGSHLLQLWSRDLFLFLRDPLTSLSHLWFRSPFSMNSRCSKVFSETSKWACHMAAIFFTMINFNWLQNYLVGSFVFLLTLFQLSMSIDLFKVVLMFPNFLWLDLINLFPEQSRISCTFCFFFLFGFSLWLPTVLGLVGKAIAVVAYHGMAICNNVTNMVASPTSNCVVEISNPSFFIMSVLQGFWPNSLHEKQ